MKGLANKQRKFDQATFYSKAAVQLFDGRVGDIYQEHIIGLEEFDRIVSTCKKTQIDVWAMDEIVETIRYYSAYLESMLPHAQHSRTGSTDRSFDRPFAKLRSEAAHQLLYLMLSFDCLVMAVLAAKSVNKLSQKQAKQIIEPIKKQIRYCMYQYAKAC